MYQGDNMKIHLKNNFQNYKGFSLIELMIVVAIIGLLAAIGIPQYAKFQAKARTSEAKAHLSSIFNGEVSFKAEWNTYTTDLSDIGVGAVGSNLRYTAGFTAAACANYAAGASSQDTTRTQIHTISSGDATWVAATGLSSGGGATAQLTGSACDGPTGFTAVAVGDPRNTPAALSSTTSDTWTITNTKTLANPVTGL